MTDQTLFLSLHASELGTVTPSPAIRAGVLTSLLRPFARHGNVFVADDHEATRVTIHKSSTLDIEVVIDTANKHWLATVRHVATGIEVARHTAAHRDHTAMLGDLHTFLVAVVEPRVRVAAPNNQLEAETVTGWQAVPHH